jgi:hypothetical protein
MRENHLGNAIVDFAPHFVGGYSSEFITRNFDGDVEVSAMTTVDDPDIPVRLHESRYFVQRANGRRQPNALRDAATRLQDQIVEP